MKTTLTLRLLAPLLMLCSASAWPDGTLTHLSGPVSVEKTDGKTIMGAVGAKVLTGDTVVTGAQGYVRMEMTDGGEIVLRPNSQLKVERYEFAKDKPADDSFVFSMLKGGLRTVTGLIGKRGNKDAYSAKTPTATIGIRGTQYDMRVCQANCGALPDGTYLAVRFGAIQTTNAQGTLAVAAGQVAHVPQLRPPVMLPRDPGIGFSPPAAIPKLDEKKKIKAAEKAAAVPAPAPAPASGKDEQKPAAKSGTASATDSNSSKNTDDSGKPAASNSAGSDKAAQADAPAAPSATTADTTPEASPTDAALRVLPPVASTLSTSTAPECVVQ